MEFLVHIELGRIDLPPQERSSLLEREAKRAQELGAQGILKLLWRVPGRTANWGVWSAEHADDLHRAIMSLPLFDYMTVTVHPLASHPNAPQVGSAEAEQQ